MGAPEGFRSISMSQAIMEYAKPLFEFAKDEENALNDTLQIGNLLTKLRKSGLIINTGSRTASRWELIKKG